MRVSSSASARADHSIKAGTHTRMHSTTTTLETLYRNIGEMMTRDRNLEIDFPGYRQGLETARLYVLDELARCSAFSMARKDSAEKKARAA